MNYNHIHQLAVMDLRFVPVDLVCRQISCLNYNIYIYFLGFFYWKVVVVLNLFFYPSEFLHRRNRQSRLCLNL